MTHGRVTPYRARKVDLTIVLMNKTAKEDAMVRRMKDLSGDS